MNDRPTTQQLDEIEDRANAATLGPWGIYESGSLIDIAADLEETGHGYRARRGIARFDEEPLDNDPGHREWSGEEDWAQVQADAAYIAAMPPETARALVAEVRRLRAERDEYCNRIDTLTAVAKGNKRHVQEMFQELQKAQAELDQWRATFGADALPDALARLKRAEDERDEARAALEQIRHLHKDSPMGPCPVCIDADASAAGGDGLVPYPCPTGRLAGAQDCDPPHVRAARPAVSAAATDTTKDGL